MPPALTFVLILSPEALGGVWGRVGVEGVCAGDGMANPPVSCARGSHKLP